MAVRKPLVIVSGQFSELPVGDNAVELAVAPSGLIYVGSKLGIDGSAQISGNAGISTGVTAQASGNAALIVSSTALASGNAGISTGITALASGNAALVVGTTALASGNAALVNTSTLSARNLVAGSGLLGGGNLSADRRFDANISSQAVAQSGTDNTTLMTPLRVAQAIAVQGATYTYTSTGSNKILGNRERCTAISGLITLSLPASPSQGGEISVVIPSGSINVVLSGVGSPIMGVQQDLTIDAVDTTVTLIYIDGSYGWRIF